MYPELSDEKQHGTLSSPSGGSVNSALVPVYCRTIKPAVPTPAVSDR
jgi:hypothetical protein